MSFHPTERIKGIAWTKLSQNILFSKPYAACSYNHLGIQLLCSRKCGKEYVLSGNTNHDLCQQFNYFITKVQSKTKVYQNMCKNHEKLTTRMLDTHIANTFLETHIANALLDTHIANTLHVGYTHCKYFVKP